MQVNLKGGGFPGLEPRQPRGTRETGQGESKEPTLANPNPSTLVPGGNASLRDCIRETTPAGKVAHRGRSGDYTTR